MALLTGISRERYEFFNIPWGTDIPRQGGILILANGTALYPRPLLIADAHSLRAEFQKYREEAHRRGATLILVKDESNPEKRAAMQADLLAAYQSPAAPTE